MFLHGSSPTQDKISISMPNADSEKEREIRKEIYENPVKKSSDLYSFSHNTWIFENYTKDRLKSLGIIH